MAKKLQSHPWLPVTLFSVILLWALFLCVRMIQPLVPLYKSAALRAEVQTAMEKLSTEQGILLSSMRIDGVDATSLHLSIREFRRGRFIRKPLTIPLFK